MRLKPEIRAQISSVRSKPNPGRRFRLSLGHLCPIPPVIPARICETLVRASLARLNGWDETEKEAPKGLLEMSRAISRCARQDREEHV